MELDTRHANKEKVIETALTIFINKGIPQTKITEIAEASGLSDRSVYRYFDNKLEIVCEAAKLFWQETVTQVEKKVKEKAALNLSGAEQILEVLLAYADIYFEQKEKLIFVQEAEVYLAKSHKQTLLRELPPGAFNATSGPLAIAIHQGISDKTVREDVNLESLYYNTFDSLMGLMQKMSLLPHPYVLATTDDRTRLIDFCKGLQKTFFREKS